MSQKLKLACVIEFFDDLHLESLRLHPIMHIHYRECTKDKQLEINPNKKLTIEKGTNVAIAVYDIERDPEYFGSDADHFNPERFNEENGGIKRYTNKGVLFPFGKIGVNQGNRFLNTCSKYLAKFQAMVHGSAQEDSLPKLNSSVVLPI